MRNFLWIFFIPIFLCTSCNSSKKKDLTQITILVNNVESIVNKHDDIVQKSLENKGLDHIDSVSKAAIDSSSTKLQQLKELVVPEDEKQLQQAAIYYIKALQNIIKSQQGYSILTDSTSIQIALKLDAQNIKIVDEAEVAHTNYINKLNALSK